jgi:hypothetical protein
MTWPLPKHIGLDLDNTIVCYDALFHRIAVEQGEITPRVPVNKTAVRDHLRAQGRDPVFTEMQGLVYGPRMSEALPFEGVTCFIDRARRLGIAVSIISHKTRYPFAGPRYDLHEAARAWIDQHLRDPSGHALLPPNRVFLEPTKQAKWGRIAAEGCDVFVDDLPEILLAAEFPARARRIWFAPVGESADGTLERLESWAVIADAVLGSP